MRVWEYKVTRYSGVESLNKMGRDGWQLCSVDERGGQMYFKRPVVTEITIPADLVNDFEAFMRKWNELGEIVIVPNGIYFFGKDWKDRDDEPDGAQRLLGSL